MFDQIKYIEEKLTAKEKQRVNDAFSEYQLDHIPTDESPTPFCFKAYDGDILIGSIEGNIFLGALRISNLLVEQNYRGQGIAKNLMRQAENLGRKNNCLFARLSTFTHQAPEFYKKLGYQVDYEQKGYAHNLSKIFLSKELKTND